MRAARIHSYGGPEVLQIDTIDRPACGPKDILVQVCATAINPIDWKMRKGTQKMIVRRTMPTILGMDVSGIVAEVGAQVTRFKVGDEVFSSPTHKRPGTYAEFLAIDENEAAHKPKTMTHVEAASIPLVGLTSWACLVDGAKLKSGEKVLIEAGSGGVGTFAIQLAKHLGATVATTCSERNIDLVKDLGADTVVNYREQSFDDALEPQDVVLEAMGGDSKAKALKVLQRGGRIASINSDMVPMVKRFGHVLGLVAVGLKLVSFKLKCLLTKNVGFYTIVRNANGDDLTKIAKIIDDGGIKAIIDKTYPLEEIAEAHRYSQSGRAKGKIVIDLQA